MRLYLSALKRKISLYTRVFIKIPTAVLREWPQLDPQNLAALKKYYKNNFNEERFLDLCRQSQIRDLCLTEIFGTDIEKISIPIGAIEEMTSKPNLVELLYVSAIAKHLRARNIFEFGTYIGRTSYYLSYASEESIVTTLDLPLERGSKTGNYLGTYFRGTEREDRIRQILCESKEFDTTPLRKKMDFIFVDGDHSYEGVKNDTEKAFDMLAPGGVIIWHDYNARPDDGLANYFVEFTKRTPLFRIHNTSILLYMDGIDPMTFQPFKMRASPIAGKRAGPQS
jgi:predicted O-methyltransferase YrrM